MEHQVASSVQAWKAFAALSNHQQSSIVSDIRGGCIMWEELRAISWNSQAFNYINSRFRWERAFTGIGMLIGAHGLVNEYTVCFFDIQNQWKMVFVNGFEAVLNQCTFERIRVIGCRKGIWHIDPDPSEIDGDWRLWVHEGKPLSKLSWDPREYVWVNPYNMGLEISLLQYTIQIGRHILLAQRKPIEVKQV
jgi:hypothetical protein